MDVPDLTIQYCRELLDEVLDSRLRHSYRPFQLSGRLEYFIHSQISRGTLQGMGETLCFAAVPTCNGLTDAHCSALLFDGKLSQQISIQALIPGDPLQTTGDVHTVNLGQDDFIRFLCRPGRHISSLSMLVMGPTGDGCEKRSGVNGFCDVVIHSH